MASPKQASESEKQWLKRTLQGPLAGGVPDPAEVETDVDEIYNLGRLPIFHAKVGETTYRPASEDRAKVEAIFPRLSRILVSLVAHQVHGSGAAGGWGSMSQAVIDGMVQATLSGDELVLRLGKSEMRHRCKFELINNPRRYGNIWGKLTIASPLELVAFRQLEIMNDGAEWLSLETLEEVSLIGVHSLSIELLSRIYNSRAPKPTHG